jgi:hypothetical protein
MKQYESYIEWLVDQPTNNAYLKVTIDVDGNKICTVIPENSLEHVKEEPTPINLSAMDENEEQ